VKASIERFLKMSPRRSELKLLEEVRATDAHTVTMRLSAPSGAFLGALANPVAMLAIFPREAVTQKDAQGRDEYRPAQKVDLIGTGPFQFVEWIPDRHVKLKRFAPYRPLPGPASGFAGERKALVDEIVFVPVPEPGARVAGLETGEYDFADAIPPGSVGGLKGNRDVAVTVLGPYTYPVVYINHTGLLKNTKLRQAIQAALDHDEMLQAGGEGAGRVDPCFYFKEQVWWTDAGKELYNQKNAAKAKRLLQEAGYKGEPITFVTNKDYDYMVKSATVMEQQLRKVGVNVKLEVYDWPGSLQVRKDMKKWDLFTSGHTTRFDPSANDYNFLPGTNFTGYLNPAVVAQIERAQRSLRFEERFAAYREIQRLVYEDVGWIKLYDMNAYQGFRKPVKGYTAWVMPRFWNVSIEK
jgi:peptide/nickel transport system substrate-binding protein